MTTIGMYYEVIPGKEQEFEAGFVRVRQAMESLPGHVSSRMYEDIESTGSYVIVSEWESHEQFRAFTQSEAFKRVVAWGREEMLRGRPRHRVYQNG